MHGHNWQEEPYTDDSTKIGNNRLSEYLGATKAGPNQKFDLVFDRAGGSDKVAGDYLYDTYQTGGILGTWGVFRVTKQEVVIDKVELSEDGLTASGSVRFVTANGDGQLPKQLKISAADASNARIDLGQADVDAEGKWSLQTAKPGLNKPFTIQAMAVTADRDGWSDGRHQNRAVNRAFELPPGGLMVAEGGATVAIAQKPCGKLEF